MSGQRTINGDSMHAALNGTGTRFGGVHLLITLLLLLQIACADRPERQAAPAPAAAAADSTQSSADVLEPGPRELSELDRFIVFGLKKVGYNRADLAQRFGQPDSVFGEAVPNRHMMTQMDSVVTVHYPDLFATVYRVNGSPDDMMMNITVRSNEFLTLPTIQVGMDANSILARFGRPHIEGDSGFGYTCRACVVDQHVMLHVRAGKVESVGFSYYVD